MVADVSASSRSGHYKNVLVEGSRLFLFQALRMPASVRRAFNPSLSF
jgi:hypothetical protein